MGPHFIPFLELDQDTARNMITVNCVSATMMTHHILPTMITNNRGAIINIVSSTSFYVMPYFSEYSATKHYMAAFTAGLRSELGRCNVVIQEIDPGKYNIIKDYQSCHTLQLLLFNCLFTREDCLIAT